MARFTRMFTALAVYFCIATVIAQGVVLGVLWSNGYLDSARLAQATAALYGIDLVELSTEVTEQLPGGTEQPSLEQIAEQRALVFKHLDLREQAIRQGRDNLSFVKRQLQKDLNELKNVRQQFKTELDALETQTVEEGDNKVRRIFENVEPKQAKQLMIQMIDDNELEEVVRMYAAMPPARQAEIAAEFKDDVDTKKLTEILRLVRKGLPQLNLIEETQSRLKQHDLQIR